MGVKIPIDKETVERMIILGMDVDRYEAQVIPDLQARVGALTRALQDLVGAVRQARQDPVFAAQVDAASTRAQLVIETGLMQLRSGAKASVDHGSPANGFRPDRLY
jgi:hypothetical protein